MVSAATAVVQVPTLENRVRWTRTGNSGARGFRSFVAGAEVRGQAFLIQPRAEELAQILSARFFNGRSHVVKPDVLAAQERDEISEPVANRRLAARVFQGHIHERSFGQGNGALRAGIGQRCDAKRLFLPVLYCIFVAVQVMVDSATPTFRASARFVNNDRCVLRQPFSDAERGVGGRVHLIPKPVISKGMRHVLDKRVARDSQRERLFVYQRPSRERRLCGTTSTSRRGTQVRRLDDVRRAKFRIERAEVIPKSRPSGGNALWRRAGILTKRMSGPENYGEGTCSDASFDIASRHNERRQIVFPQLELVFRIRRSAFAVDHFSTRQNKEVRGNNH